MRTFRAYIAKFTDWLSKLGDDAMRYNRNPNVQHSHLLPPPNARRKATKLIDEKIFGIGKRKNAE